MGYSQNGIGDSMHSIENIIAIHDGSKPWLVKGYDLNRPFPVVSLEDGKGTIRTLDLEMVMKAVKHNTYRAVEY